MKIRKPIALLAALMLIPLFAGPAQANHPAPATGDTPQEKPAAVPATDGNKGESAAGGAADKSRPNDTPAENATGTTGETASTGSAEISPAPSSDGTSAGKDSSGSGGGDGKTVLLIVVAGLAIGTIAGFVYRARR